MRVRADGAWREVSTGRVRVGGAWKEIASVRVYVGGAWKEADSFAVPFTALTVSPDPIFTTGDVGTTRQSPPAIATATGGTLPITYAWTRVSGDTGFTINSPSSASTTFSRFLLFDEIYSAVFQCTATDALGVARSDTVSVSISGITEAEG